MFDMLMYLMSPLLEGMVNTENDNPPVEKSAIDLVNEEVGINRHPVLVLECRTCQRKCLADLREYHESICNGIGEEDNISHGSNDNQSVNNSNVDMQSKKRDLMMEICIVCGRKYSSDVIERHKKTCLSRFNLRQETQKRTEVPLESCLPPNPPLNFTASDATSNSLTLRWVRSNNMMLISL